MANNLWAGNVIRAECFCSSQENAHITLSIEPPIHFKMALNHHEDTKLRVNAPACSDLMTLAKAIVSAIAVTHDLRIVDEEEISTRAIVLYRLGISAQ